MPSALIVEDEPEANRLLAMLVRLRGHATTSAFTGAEALDRARAEAPDLVFLDLMLPDRDGLGVCQALKADPATTAIPVIMVTARLAPENRLRGFRAGATDYVPKPYTPDQIFAAIAHAQRWTDEVRADASELTIPLGMPGDPAALVALTRLRSTLLAQGLPTAGRAGRLDAFLGGLADLAARAARPASGGPVLVLDYRRTADRLAFALRERALAGPDAEALDRLVAEAADLFDATGGAPGPGAVLAASCRAEPARRPA